MPSAIDKIKTLVASFSSDESDITRRDSEYNETQLRRDYIDRFFKALGWDIDNSNRLPQHLREVVHEANVQVEKTKKRPDYAFKVAGTRKFFVEAKKPSVNIEKNSESAFQLRRYGWSAKMPISILTNFKYLMIYDCRHIPKEKDDYRICRIKVYHSTEYEKKFDEIFKALSHDSAFSGKFDELYPIDEEIRGTNQIDSYFLSQIDEWRLKLSAEILKKNKTISQEELNYLVQTFLNRIVFLRICEDRDLEKYETLLKVDASKVYQDLLNLFKEADKKYNSELFDFTRDTLSSKIGVGNEVLLEIIKELYYPRSPYIFSVIESNVLGDIYELFLTEQIKIKGKKKVILEEKHELYHDKGIVTTPKFIIDNIIEKTLVNVCKGKSPDQILKHKIADIACGSGSFLLEGYQFLLNYTLEWYLKDPKKYKKQIYKGESDFWYLALSEKRKILVNNIYGVDIDENAVEVAKFSLLVKLLEGETNDSIKHLLVTEKLKALPDLKENIKCGNSLVDNKLFKFKKASSISTEELNSLNPFEWQKKFPVIFKNDGFDVILGNPPYTRIQTMKRVTASELEYYQSKHSKYECAKKDNVDKYMLFVERSIELLKDGGRLGYIIPHKFTKIKAGETLRDIISKNSYLEDLVLFGTQQVFGKKSTTYTALLVLKKSKNPKFEVEAVTDLQKWKLGNPGQIELFPDSHISQNRWIFLIKPLRQLIDRIQKSSQKLQDLADIYVGLQTSKDEIYIIRPSKITKKQVSFTDFNGKKWNIEKDILRPSIYDLILSPWKKPESNSYIIFPYYTDKQGRSILYSQAQMKKNFKKTWDYLKKYKKELEKRKIQPFTKDTWYRYGRSQSLAKFDGREKLIIKVLSQQPCFALDDSNILFTGGGNGPYYGISLKKDTKISLYYLQAFLNNKLVEIMVSSSSSVFRGEYYSYGKQFTNDLPVPIPDLDTKNGKQKYDEIVRLSKKIRKLNDQLDNTSIPSKRDVIETQIYSVNEELNNEIFDVYGVDKNEKKLIADFTL